MTPTVQRCRVTPQQAATLVDQVVVALERGDTSTARSYAESLRARLQVQTTGENAYGSNVWDKVGGLYVPDNYDMGGIGNRDDLQHAIAAAAAPE